MSRTGIFSFLNSTAVPPVEMISTPCPSSARANAATPALLETEMSARRIFIRAERLERCAPFSPSCPLSHWRSKGLKRTKRRNPSAVEENVLSDWIKHRAAADGFAKCFAEMTQARVADFCRGFSDVVTSGAQQLGRAFHPHVAQILRNGETDFARKNPAQIKRAAAHLLSQHFQGWRVR